jgi:ATP-dependent helicase/nuclease subunit B
LLELAPDLEAVLTTGQTVVVPTAQRAAALRLAFATRQLRQGRRAFRTPDVQSLSGWLRGQPGAKDAAGVVLRRLGASEEWLLWREAVAAAAARLSLPAAGLVDAVRQSAALLYEWRIAPAAVRQSGTPEALLLSHSLDAIETRLADLGAAAPWRALQDLAAAPPRRAPVFAGFAQPTPARRSLLEAWRLRGTPAQELACTFGGTSGCRAAAADPSAELALIAHWCRERLQASPTARLLVIVPDLARRQGEVRRVFDAALDPDYPRVSVEGDVAPYAVEGGQSLPSYAPILAGLGTLRLLAADVEFAEVSQWLRGSFWLQPPASRRAMLDAWLRTVVPPRLNARQLLQALRAAPPALLVHADEVAAVLRRLQEAFAGGSRATLAAWSGRFAQVLMLCGLHAGAARQRDSREQQVLQRLDELLQECAALPGGLGTFDAVEALAVFTRLLARTRFEPATGDAPVTITASLADPLLRYDGIWVSGLHAGTLPERARFDPFIPVSLQRQAGIIAADPAARVSQAEQALNILCRSSHEFIVSAPAHAEDLELTASPLLAPYALDTYPAPGAADGLPQRIRASRRMEAFVDDTGAAWPEAVPLPAGTRAIELQSRCPFRAYAQLRLRAEPLESPLPGITSRERGRMLHRALELLWQGLGGSAALAVARANQLQAQLVSDCVAQAGSEILDGADPEASEDESFYAAADATGLTQLRRAAIARELGRAARLINALCDLEAARAPFVVHELETKHRVRSGGALIDVRVDRMDRLEDGTQVILDYKSGRAVTPDWEVERTTHPQLLVYLLAAAAPVSALAVAHLDPKSVVFKGIGDADLRLPGVKAAAGSWSRQLAAWNAQVAQLASDFIRGDARVAPMDKACDYCHLHAFCRIADVDSDLEEQP